MSSVQATPADWPQYYRATAGRAPRPLLMRALALCREPEPERRQAIDVGCGDGTDTLALLERGWHVLALDSTPEAIAILRSRVPAGQEERLQTQAAPFAAMKLAETNAAGGADLIFAGLSLPFCHPDDFGAVWARLLGALRPGGVFACHLFGERDSWAVSPGMTFHSRPRAEALFEGLRVEHFGETEEDGRAVSGPKHWHLFEVVARRE